MTKANGPEAYLLPGMVTVATITTQVRKICSAIATINAPAGSATLSQREVLGALFWANAEFSANTKIRSRPRCQSPKPQLDCNRVACRSLRNDWLVILHLANQDRA